MQRCHWAQSELMVAYHDQEWGVPLHDDRALFEFLILEGAQAGLSWETILKKRAAYRAAFDKFDARKIARYDAKDQARLLADAGIVRNRLKIAAAIRNARRCSKCKANSARSTAIFGNSSDGQAERKPLASRGDVPARTPESDAMSKDLLAADSNSSARRSATPSCKPSAW